MRTGVRGDQHFPHEKHTIEAGSPRMDEVEARKRRNEAAARYRPDTVDFTLVAEAPPGALDRYFYFEEVTEQDPLFRYVVRGILSEEPTRENKAELLARLRDQGVFLIDLRTDPVDGCLSPAVPPT